MILREITNEVTKHEHIVIELKTITQSEFSYSMPVMETLNEWRKCIPNQQLRLQNDVNGSFFNVTF